MQRIGILALWLTICVSIGALGVRVLPASHHLEQEPGTVETYTVTVLNDTEETEELSLYIGDWQRFEDGEHDWGVSINGARWIFDRPFSVGETAEIVYSIQLPSAAGLGISGSHKSLTPQASDSTAGSGIVQHASTGDSPTPSDLPIVWIGRTIESIDVDGLAIVRLSIQCNVAFEGLVVEEITAERAHFDSLEDAGARFDTINRSNAEWITLSHNRLVLQPDESRDIILTIDMPADTSGTYWSAVFVESRPQASDVGGTQVISIYRTAIKIYVTAFGSDDLAGQVIDVQVGETSPLVLYALFENTGNVELVVTGEAQIVDRTGTVVRDLFVDEFKVLPGAKRIVTIIDSSGGSDSLPAEIYQAVVSFDYGGANPVVGVRGFRIR